MAALWPLAMVVVVQFVDSLGGCVHKISTRLMRWLRPLLTG
jgi:hypothetical protein